MKTRLKVGFATYYPSIKVIKLKYYLGGQYGEYEVDYDRKDLKSWVRHLQDKIWFDASLELDLINIWHEIENKESK